MEQDEEAITKQEHGKHVSAPTDQHTTIEELLVVVDSVWSTVRLYSEAQWKKLVSQRLDLGGSSQL